MKYIYHIILICNSLLFACSNIDHSRMLPLPPKNLDERGTLPLPNPVNNKVPNFSAESKNILMMAESTPIRFKQITEERGPGGAINRVNIYNPRAGIPNYYLSPTLDQQTNTNNNPDKISTPNWQINW